MHTSGHEVDEVSGIHTGTRLILGDHEPTRKSTHGQGIATCSPSESNRGRHGYHPLSLPRMLSTTRLQLLAFHMIRRIPMQVRFIIYTSSLEDVGCKITKPLYIFVHVTLLCYYLILLLWHTIWFMIHFVTHFGC